MNFKASYDTTVKILSFFVTLLLIVLVFPLRKAPLLPLVIYLIVCVATIAISFGFSILHYSIQNETLIIHRPFGNKEFPIRDIQQAIPIDPKSLKWSIRLWGNGGLFGFYGIFSNNKFGRMHWYMTNKKTPVLLQLSKKKIIVSPDDPIAFIVGLKLL